MFTLYRIVKRSVAESVLDRASVHNRNHTFEAVGFYAEQISMSVKSAGPIAWSWK